ncbi:MAG: hypothetical protein IPF47_14585 [Gemmatimonadetes bacterium]|nr:hypothetical protein [Gemmatimonadota bacterium]
MPTDYFFVMPSAVRGAASVVDLAGVLREGDYVFVGTSEEADALAFATDRRALARDFAVAKQTLESQVAAATK